MRIRVRVTALVEMLSYIRQTNGRLIRTGAEPKVSAAINFQEKIVLLRQHRDGVAHRPSGGGKIETPARPMNNAGEAIQAPRLSQRAPRPLKRTRRTPSRSRPSTKKHPRRHLPRINRQSRRTPAKADRKIPVALPVTPAPISLRRPYSNPRTPLRLISHPLLRYLRFLLSPIPLGAKRLIQNVR